MNSNAIFYIKLDKLEPHPDNPRKELGDLTELIDSIRAMGIMQNLTVVPLDDQWEKLRIVIGHRRAAAARLAGLTEVPCVIIEDMSEQDQVATMLLENIQRSDLTITEQAEGFQMMIDMGDSVAEVSRKTGFGETTIRHRVKLLELDQEVLRDKQSQMKMTDLILLEKIKDPERKDRLLKIWGGDSNFALRVESEVEAEKLAETKAKAIELLEAAGLSSNTETWSMDCTGKISLEAFDGEIEIPEGTTYYNPNVTSYKPSIGLYKEREQVYQQESDEKKKKVEEARERLTQLRATFNKMNSMVTKYLGEVAQKGFSDNEKALIQKTAQKAVLSGGYYGEEDIYEVLRELGIAEAGPAEMEENDITEALEKTDTDIVWLAFCVKLLRVTCISDRTWAGRVEYYENPYSKAFANLAQRLGYTYSDEEKSILNGTHELYDKEEK